MTIDPLQAERMQEEYNQKIKMKQAKLSASAQFGVNSYWLLVIGVWIIWTVNRQPLNPELTHHSSFPSTPVAREILK